MPSKVVVEAEIRPTEDEDKVLKAITNFFDVEKIETVHMGGTRILVVTSNNLACLAKLHRALRSERILDAARSSLKKGVRETTITFHLHKQAAYAGKLSFVDGDHESPLGAIRVTIHHSNPQDVIDWLAPPTSKGKPIWEKEMPV
ncbi:MAG: hypothetical protein LM578_05365 [Desulfurococcaceae archaeon]|jgi:predicted RNA binding protein with dsRBD fold (UPF0201 family)|nr:hypothetical protein [Desulfurococcaceae archaeon]